MWKVEFRDCFHTWLTAQSEDCQTKVASSLRLLQEFGPQLGRPYVDSVKGSSFANMKELQIQEKGCPVRAFFAFDPERKAIILCAGDKSNDKTFYLRLIRIADEEYREHLSTLGGVKL